jgi:hypothetical protein
LEGVTVFDEKIGGVARTSRCGSNESSKQQCSKHAHHSVRRDRVADGRVGLAAHQQ